MNILQEFWHLKGRAPILDRRVMMMFGGLALGAIPNGVLMKSFPFRWNSFGGAYDDSIGSRGMGLKYNFS